MEGIGIGIDGDVSESSRDSDGEEGDDGATTDAEARHVERALRPGRSARSRRSSVDQAYSGQDALLALSHY